MLLVSSYLNVIGIISSSGILVEELRQHVCFLWCWNARFSFHLVTHILLMNSINSYVDFQFVVIREWMFS